MRAGGDITLDAAANKTTERFFQETTRSGLFSTGRLGFPLGTQQQGTAQRGTASP